jgi:hypothetical protein
VGGIRLHNNGHKERTRVGGWKRVTETIEVLSLKMAGKERKCLNKRNELHRSIPAR